MHHRISTYSLLVLLMLFSVQLRADTYSFSLTEKLWSGWGTKEINGVEWTLNGTNAAHFGYDIMKGHQFGSAANPNEWLSLKTTDIEGDIYSVKVTASGASAVNAQLAVLVGGEVFSPESSNLSSLSFTYEFTGINQGEIHIHITNNSSKALYIKAVELEYSPYVEPSVTIEEVALNFEAEIDASEEYALTVEGQYLEADIEAEISGEDAEKFQFSFAENFDLREGGIIFLEYKPDYEEDVHIASFTLSSEGTPSKEIDLMGVGKAITSVENPVEDLPVWTDKHQIHFYANLHDTIELINLSGKKILQTTAHEGLNTIHIQASGVMIIKINHTAHKIIM